MVLVNKLSLGTWSKYLDENLFTQSEGFAELPYLSNSGEIMRDSVIALNESEHNLATKNVSCNNEVLEASMYYRRIMDGLWLFGTEVNVKQPIVCRALYDEIQESNMYVLSFAVFNYYYPINILNEDFVRLSSMTNTLYKPNTKAINYFYKGSNGLFFNVGFTKEWALKYLNTSAGVAVKMNQFLDGKIGLVNWVDIMPNAEVLIQELWTILSTNEEGEGSLQELANIIIEAGSHFFNQAMLDPRIDQKIILKKDDFQKLAKAEQIILSELSSPFIGVNQIAHAVNMSATKLKASFKSIYGFSMLQYHKERNMLLAYQILKDSDTQIKFVTELVGFTSVSKFSAAFKKRFGLLPSSLRKNEGEFII